jgi:8-oxo-dGTP diphosphatase
MQLLKTIRQQDFEPGSPIVDGTNFFKRTSARAVVTDANGAVALLHVSNHGYYKLPGGGIEAEEDSKLALLREIMEEIGCNAKITGELGIIIEHRDYWEMHQTSYCYVARVIGAKGHPAFTQEETADGFEIVWAKDLPTALSMVEGVKPADIDQSFMRLRDATVLRVALDAHRK